MQRGLLNPSAQRLENDMLVATPWRHTRLPILVSVGFVDSGRVESPLTRVDSVSTEVRFLSRRRDYKEKR